MQKESRKKLLDVMNTLREWDNDASMVLDDYIQLRKVVRKLVAEFDKEETPVSNIRNKCLCKLIKGAHSLDDHGQEGD
jgi:hypothetical protein